MDNALIVDTISLPICATEIVQMETDRAVTGPEEIAPGATVRAAIAETDRETIRVTTPAVIVVIVHAATTIMLGRGMAMGTSTIRAHAIMGTTATIVRATIARDTMRTIIVRAILGHVITHRDTIRRATPIAHAIMWVATISSMITAA